MDQDTVTSDHPEELGEERNKVVRNVLLQSYLDYLEQKVEIADAKLQMLHIELVSTRQQHNSACIRCEKLENLTKIVCDDCWVILPTLGRDVHDQAMTPIVLGLSCVNCGAVLVTTAESGFDGDDDIELPPPPGMNGNDFASAVRPLMMNSIAELNCVSDEAEDVTVQVAHQHCDRISCDRIGPILRASSRRKQLDRKNSNKKSIVGGHNEDFCILMASSKQDYLAVVTNQKRRADNKLKQIKHAIELWTNYRSGHQDQLDRLQQSVFDSRVQDKTIYQED